MEQLKKPSISETPDHISIDSQIQSSLLHDFHEQLSFENEKYIMLIDQFNQACTTNSKSDLIRSLVNIYIFLGEIGENDYGNEIVQPLESSAFFSNLIDCFKIKDDELTFHLSLTYGKLHFVSSGFAGSKINVATFCSIYGIITQGFFENNNHYSPGTFQALIDLIFEFVEESCEHLILLIQLGFFRFLEHLYLNTTNLNFLLSLLNSTNILASNGQFHSQIPYASLIPIINSLKIILVSAIFGSTDTPLPPNQEVFRIHPERFAEYHNASQQLINDVKENKIGYKFHPNILSNDQHNLIQRPLVFFEGFANDIVRTSILFNCQVPHLCYILLDPSIPMTDANRTCVVEWTCKMLCNFFQFASKDDIQAFLPILNVELLFFYTHHTSADIINWDLCLISCVFYYLDNVQIDGIGDFLKSIINLYYSGIFGRKCSILSILITLILKGNETFVKKIFLDEEIIDILIEADTLSIVFPFGSIYEALAILAKVFQTENESDVFLQLAPYLNENLEVE